jgi:hypothetical protein
MIPVNVATCGKEGRCEMKKEWQISKTISAIPQAGLADSFLPLFCHGGPRHERNPAIGFHSGSYHICATL